MLRILIILSWTCILAFTLRRHSSTKNCKKECGVRNNCKIAAVDECGDASMQTRKTYNHFIHRRRLLIYGSVIFPSFLHAADGEDQCKDGRMALESAVPGAYQQMCMSMDKRSFRLKTGDTITVFQGTNSAGGTVAGRTGVAVWNSGILLTRLIDEINTYSSFFKGKKVIELGCGVGLASIALAKFGASSVLATDANMEVLELAKQNFELNKISSIAKTTELHWGLLDASEYDSVADIIVGSDLTYNSGSWLSLAETISTILKPDGVVLYLTLGHSGFNVQAELGGFLQIAENFGLQTIQEEHFFGQSLIDLLARITTSDEKQVINANGGARAVLLGKKKI